MFRPIYLFAGLVITQSVCAQNWEREDVGFSSIQDRAKDIASRPYKAPSTESQPAWIKKLTYDQYRDIRFNPEHALWATEKLPFRAMFFHPGYLFREPVTLMEITEKHQQEIRLSEAYFNYGPLIKNHGDLPTEGGFAGFRLHAPLNQADYYDELIVFQGGCYWRALGKNQRYGISSRGIALNTGVEGTPEEFPAFREFWLRKPKEGESVARFYGLLDGPSYTGAYSFRVYPGDDTRVDVRAVLYARKVVKRLGIAPMSSMFWFGENARRRFDDFRPEVHDSDGLAIQMGNGERIWRPITNDSDQVGYSYFNMDECKGFGLLQRDRRFETYEDAEASYHLRPSLWIEPKSDWGSGRVMLMEIPTTNELSDNTVALWEPSTPVLPGQQTEFRYTQHWTTNPDPSEAKGYVVATRSGVHDWEPNHRTVIVEFAGPNLNNLEKTHPSAVVNMLGDAEAKAVIKNINVQPIANQRWRLSFQITPKADNGKLNEIGPLELRCYLKNGDDYLTETWAYRINP